MICRYFRRPFMVVLMALFLVACGNDPSVVLGAVRSSAYAPPLGEACSSADPAHICLALKYAAYNDLSGKPVISSAAAIQNVREINGLWAQCNLGFQLEQYVVVNPQQYALQFNPSNISELDDIRTHLADPQSLLVVTTGKWNRAGTLGSSGANAWTSMPGSGPYGAILEQPVANYSFIIGHELGHFLNLYHVSDLGDLMNPIIYTYSTRLDRIQCETVRAAAQQYWLAAQR